MTILLIFYQAVFSFAVLVLLPFFPLKRGRKMRQKLGLDLKEVGPFRNSIWVHALSVGEVMSAVPLIDVLNEQFPENDIVFSATTQQGIAVARKHVEGKVKAVIPMPMDFWWSIRRALLCVNPAVFVLVETDIWPGLLSAVRRKRIKCLLVNGRISPKTYAAYRKFSFVVRTMFGFFDSCLLQSDLDRERLLAVGVDRKKVKTTGNIKFDRPWVPMEEGEKTHWMKTLGIRKGDIVIVAGSTHQGEEVILLRTCRRIMKKYPELHLVIAPRRIERAAEVFSIAQDEGFSPALKTSIASGAVDADVLILDTLGELGRIYGLAQISFVGGSLVPFGGHNLLEPASFGCPVLFGPHTENFVRMSEQIIRMEGGWRVQDGEQLEKAILQLLQDRDLCRSMGEHAREFVFKNRGALNRAVKEIDQLLKQRMEEARWR